MNASMIARAPRRREQWTRARVLAHRNRSSRAFAPSPSNGSPFYRRFHATGRRFVLDGFGTDETARVDYGIARIGLVARATDGKNSPSAVIAA